MSAAVQLWHREASIEPYYHDELVTIYHGDARKIVPELYQDDFTCLVIDPPYDDDELVEWSSTLGRFQSELVFTDPRHLGAITSLFGPPVWVFTWDTMAGWSVGPSRPVTQTKFALWYGALDQYDRDAVLWGEAPEFRDHPSTKQVPLDGRRLTDLWRESLRWLHNPSAGNGSAGTERFAKRQGESVMRHAKPVGWLRCLIGNTAGPYGSILDPFMGSGTTLEAAIQLQRHAVGIDINEEACWHAARRCAQKVLF